MLIHYAWLEKMLGSKKLNLRNRLPKPTDHSAAQIARINELTKAGRANWLGLLAYLAFAFITVLAVQDADFFIPSRETKLPLINVSIPTFSFFYFAPALAAALYVYLHLHVRKVTEALAETTATVNSHPIEEYLTPWLLNDFVLRRRGDAAIRTRTLDRLGDFATLCLIWLSGPLVVGWFWVRSWPAHDQIMTLFLAICFGLCLLTGYKSYFWMWQKLGSDKPRYRLVDFVLSLGRTSAKSLCVFLVLVSWARTEGGFTGPPWGEEISNFINQKTIFRAPDWLTYDPPVWIRFTFLMAQTDLSNIEFVKLPPDARDPLTSRQRFRYDWCKRASVAPEACGRYLSSKVAVPAYQDDVRLAWCRQSGRKIFDRDACLAFFAGLDDVFITEWKAFRTSTLAAISKPDFSGKDLRRADFRYSTLAGVSFVSAQMEGATLRGAQMEGADFTRAQMEGANLTSAQMEGADLSEAQLEGADLWEAQLEGADLWRAQMEGANLMGAQMEGADLWEAQMEGAILMGAQMEGADLWEAQMEGAILTGAQMRSVKWAGAIFSGSPAHSADLRGAVSLGQDQLDLFIGDENTLLPTGFHVWSCWIKPPKHFEEMVSVAAKYNIFENEEDIRAKWLCPEGTHPQKTGTQLGLDEDPPWKQ